MEDWRRHFSKFHQPTQYDLYRRCVADGHGRSACYKAVYGKLPGDTAREFAEYLHQRGYSLREISIFVKLRFGVGCKSVIHRWLNPKAMQKHLKSKRKSS